MRLIIESQFLAPVIAYKKSIQITNIEFELYDTYRKMSFRNRCVIIGSNGPITLSVPLEEGREQKLPLREVRIANRQPWQSQHWKTILSCYNRSPWFEFYRHGLEELYSRPFEFLVDWNLACWEWMDLQLGSRMTTQVTDRYLPHYDQSEYIDWRNRLMPRSIQQDFPDPVRYRQVFEDRTGFIPHCSIIDLLFCEGKNAINLLTQP